MFEEKMKKVIDASHRDEIDDRLEDKHDHHHDPHPDRPPEHEKKVVIYVNGRPFEWKKLTISFEEVITLAFGSFNPAPHIAYTVSYFDGPRDFKEGKLTKGHSTFNPCKNCKIPPKEKSEMVIIPPEKIGAYLAEAENYGLLPMFYTELTTGLRRGELLAIEWTDLDIDSSTLTVNKQVTRIRGELVVSEPKTKNSIRKIILPKQTVELLVGEHQRHPDSPLMFPSPRTGEYWSPDAIGRIHKRLLERAEIDEAVRFHDLRHTFATLAIQNGVDAKTVAGMLGHYSATFSLDTYTHITNTMQQNAAARIGAFMEKATTQCEWKEDT